MYTYCPDCLTIYEISTEELGTAAGLVKCGSCDAIFSALRRLTDTPPVITSSTDRPSDSGQAHLDFSSAAERHEQSLKDLGMEETANGEHELIFPTFEDESYPDDEESTELPAEATDTADIEANADSEGLDDAALDATTGENDSAEPTTGAADSVDMEANLDSEELDDATSDATSITGENDSAEPTTEAADSVDMEENLDSEELDDATSDATSITGENDSAEPTTEAADSVDMEANLDSDELDDATSDTPSTAADKKSAVLTAEAADIETDADSRDLNDAALDVTSTTDDDADDMEDEAASEEGTDTEIPETITATGAASEYPRAADDEVTADTVDDQEEDLFDELIHEIDELADLETLIDTSADHDSSVSAFGASDADGDDKTISDDAADTLEDWDTEEGAQDLEELLADTALLDDGATSETDSLADGPVDDSEAQQALDGEPSGSDGTDAARTEATDDADLSANRTPEPDDQNADILIADVDGKFEAGNEADDEHDYRDLRHYLKPGKSLVRKVGEATLLLLLVALLGAQFLHHNRAMFATHPEFGGAVQSAYKSLGLNLDIAWSTDDYRVARHTIVPDDSDRQKLMARATIVNNSPQGRPLPMVRLELRNRWGDPIFARIFSADEYLQMPVPEQLAGNGRVEVALDIHNPTDDIEIGYSFDVCVSTAGGGAYCGPAEVFRGN